MLNKVQLQGNLTRDPELNHYGDTTVVKFRIAVNRPKRGGEDRGADYVDITAFGKLAENVAEYKTKGDQVLIDGRLRHSEWKDDQDNTRSKLEVVADDVIYLSTGARKGTEQTEVDEPVEEPAF